MALSPLKLLGKLPFAAGLILTAQAVMAGTLTNVSVTPADPAAGAITTYTFAYTLEEDVNADELLFYVTFPSDFTVDDTFASCDYTSFTLTPDQVGTICHSYGSGNTVGFAVNRTVGGGASVDAGTAVEVVVSGVTNPATPGNYVFDIADDTGIFTTQTIDFMFPMPPMAKDTAPQQTVTITGGGGGGGEDGVCGASNGGTFSATPVASLCSAGSATAVTTNATTYTWDCNGTGGSVVVDSCSANKGYDLILSISPPSGGSVSCTSNPVIHAGNTTCTPTASLGYSFADWSGDCSGASCILNNVTSSLNPQANFNLNTYAITTAVSPSTAGSVSCTNNPVNHGDDSSCTYTANPGYTFANWSGDCTGASCDLTNVTAVKSVTANFTAPTFAITTSVSPVGAGTASCTPNPVNGGNNATCTASASTAYNFTGWSGDCTGSSCTLTAVAAVKSVTANFALKTYSISGASAPVAGGSVTCSGAVSHGSNSSCTASGNAGYTFVSWTGCPSASGSTCNFTNVTSNKSVTANFTLNIYTLTSSANPMTSGTVTCPSSVNHGSDANCTSSANVGFSVASWAGCSSSSGNTCTLTNVTSDSNVSATFAVATYKLVGGASPKEGGTVECTGPVSHGGSGSCTAKSNPGYYINTWVSCHPGVGGSYSYNECTFRDVTSDKMTSALFSLREYVVSAVANPIDAGSATCTGPTLHGYSASCSAKAAAGYRLKDWSGACSGASCSIDSVTANSSVTANFELLPTYNVSTSVAPADSGTVTCTKDIMEGGTATCTAKAKAGYRFSSWGGDCSGTATSCTLTNITSAKSVTANFEQASEFTISASLEAPNGNIESTDVYGPSLIDTGSKGLKCSATNPVARGNSVSCQFNFGLLSDREEVRGFSGDCSRVEGNTCYLDNIATDKHIIIRMGTLITHRAMIVPTGAGSLWCDSDSYIKITADIAAQRCKAEANPGYVFTSYGVGGGALDPIIVTFTKQANTPAVTCTNCNSSTTSTDTSTTQTASQTGEPDANGNTSQTTVSTTTNTQTGVMVTSGSVGTTNSDGQTQLGGGFNSNDPNTQITVGGNNSITATSANTVTGTTATTIVSPTGTSTSVFSDDTINRILALTSSLSQTVTFNSSSTQTSFTVSGSDGLPLGTTTVSGISTSTQSSSSLITTTGTSSTVSYTSSNLTVTASLGGLVSTSVSPIASSQTTSIIAGNISSGLGGGFGGGFGVGLGASFTVSSGGSSMEVTGRGGAGDENLQGKPGLRKTSAADDNREVLMDVTGDNLQSIQLSSDSAGLVEFFKPGTGTNTPQMTHIDVMSDSVSLTLTYPVAQ